MPTPTAPRLAGDRSPLRRSSCSEAPSTSSSSSPGARPARAPGGEHAVEPLLRRVGPVGDRGDVPRLHARAAPSSRPGRGSTSARASRRSAAAPRAGRPRLQGSSSGAWRSRAALERPLPQAVASRPVAGGGSVEADRSRPRPEQRGGGARVDHRARCESEPARARAARASGPRPRRDRSEQRAHLVAAGRPRRPPTLAPARRSESASSSSARRRPPVEPSETISTSTAPVLARLI